ncbi:MAG: murein biosynthesis integral membrane protein MurJ [Bacteriovoracia bacterium]
MASEALSARVKDGPTSTDNPSGVLKAAGAMGAATFLSRIMGLVREQVFAVFFGAGFATDAFNIAFRIPNLLRDLFAEGAMSAAMVPTFVRVRKEQGDARAWRLAGLVFRCLFWGVGALTVLGVIFAEPLVAWYASAFRAVPGKFELTVELTRVMFPFFPLVALAAAFMGILNACGKFFWPAFSSALFNLVSIVVGLAMAWWLPRWGYHPIAGMAVGVVAGGAVQAFSQLPALYRVGYRWNREGPAWHQEPALRGILLLMVPGTLGLAATQINLLVNSILATSQGTGAVSWLNYAFRLMQFPIGVFGVSLAAATLPAFSRSWVEGDAREASRTAARSLRQVFAVNLPAAAGLAFLGAPIIQMIFQYGRFSAGDTAATAGALAFYSIGLVFYSAVKVLVPVSYAMGITRVAVGSSVLSVVANLGLNWWLVSPLGFQGLALGTSLTAALNCCFLIFYVDRKLARSGAPRIFPAIFGPFLQQTFLALGMGLVCVGANWGLETWMMQTLPSDLSVPILALARLIRVGILVALGIAAVAALGRLFRISDTTESIDFFWSRVKKRLRTPRT